MTAYDITVAVDGTTMSFRTYPTLFSPRHADRGTLAMLSCIAFAPGDKVLDLGCGYGLVGVYAALCIGGDAVTLCDIDPLAIECACGNAAANGVPAARVILSDGFEEIGDTGYSIILSHPPYHADFGVPKRFIEKGFNRLKMGGRMALVTKRKGWYQNKLRAVFGGSVIHEIDGYYVFIAEKRRMRYAAKRETG